LKIPRRKQQTRAEIEDIREPFRFGFYDESGYVYDVTESTSKKLFESLKMNENTKPFKYPLENGGYIDVYLGGRKVLSRQFSHDGIWLSADLCFTNFELTGSQTGKLFETYQRVGDIKARIGDEFSFRANIFLVLMVIIGGFALFAGIGKLLIH